MIETKPYTKMLAEAVANSGLTYAQIIQKCSLYGCKFTPSYLSRLCKGLDRPASDKNNRALAKVLGIDFKELTKAKYKELLDPDVYEILAR